MSAEDAAALIPSGSTVGMSGFTGSGYPKQVPVALAARIKAERAAGNPFRISVWTGASTGPELDGALAKADGIEFRLPYNSDPIAREKINKGQMEYLDMHQRAKIIMENCAHPTYKPRLEDYYARALKGSYGLQTPTLLDEALSWHNRFVETGSMLPG